MKSIIIIIACLLIVSCGKVEKKTIDVIDNGGALVLVKTEPVIAQNTLQVVKFDNQELGISFLVEYELFFNENHPRGYVIIHRVTRKASDETIDYTIRIAEDPETYVELIHNHNAFSSFTTNGVVSLEEQKFRESFRTAEAVVMCADLYPISQVAVQAAGQRMEGRKVGIGR